MKVLLDTHVFLWYLSGNKKLSKKQIAVIESPGNEKFVSIASIWEIAIKLSLSKIELSITLQELLDAIFENGFFILSIELEHIIAISTLDFIHRDPFDRILISQSIAEKLILLTNDDQIKEYNISTI